MEFSHIPVLLEQTIEALEIKKDGIYVDGTAGGGGHSEQIAKRLDGGRLISIDRDPDALAAASSALRLTPVRRLSRVIFPTFGKFSTKKALILSTEFFSTSEFRPFSSTPPREVFLFTTTPLST